ncbi:YicC/YloC family endoribonuclease [Propylenella binzhouense]|uniref:YicC family protein n=1 Tax=Propylenella binzhouense TaxID=2555902 RepID=A0A964WTV9_9HYPH|nr:YicC/YloC family endoribonuclease [Propylenella binzhouense]MYZ48409.1 YicC family protein [Propylenella binzhouense]
MDLNSMTGFARTAFEAGGERYAWELKSVNGRGLELRFRLPPGLDVLEPDLRQLARERLARGSCQFGLVREGAAESAPVRINEAVLVLVLARARRLADEEGVSPPSADGLLSLPGVVEQAQAPLSEGEAEARDAAIRRAFEEAVADLAAARREEGARLGRILRELVGGIAGLVDRAAALGADAPERLRARIAEQVEMLTGAGAALDPERLHQEAVLAATRADIREEIDRLRSHLESAGARLREGGAIGRRLDFLAQEFNREANTLCAKAFDSRLSALGLELKTLVDQFREQVQNLE